jgi:hypothetical protein
MAFACEGFALRGGALLNQRIPAGVVARCSTDGGGGTTGAGRQLPATPVS